MGYLHFIIVSHIIIANCEYGNKEDFKNIQGNLPFFKRQVDHNHVAAPHSLRSAGNDVASFLVDNLNDVFGDSDSLESNVSETTVASVLRKIVPVINNNEVNVRVLHGNNKNSTYNLHFKTEQGDLETSDSNKVMKLLEKFEIATKIRANYTPLEDEGIMFNDTQHKIIVGETKRTCIYCNNVKIERCHDPRRKVVPSILCERDTDVCYAQHTPFGIIDRGCFNVDHNLTTYVCSCNLCNYISISEMPYIFTNKQDWVDNVAELSRTRNFRKSVFKDMACLWCEANSTANASVVENDKCLEGIITYLPTQICKENEICGVIAVKSQGYIWRGCLKAPLYNYWFDLCETDLCNYQPLEPIYSYL